MLQERRSGRECLIGQHEYVLHHLAVIVVGASSQATTAACLLACLWCRDRDVFHQCYESDADPEVEQFVGSYTNNTYVRNEHADAFVQLLDIGPFGFGRRVTNCAVQVCCVVRQVDTV